MYEHRFASCTDQKPLISLINEKKAVPQMALSWIQNQAVTLRAYEYAIVYKAGKKLRNAAALSHLPLPETYEKDKREETV